MPVDGAQHLSGPSMHERGLLLLGGLLLRQLWRRCPMPLQQADAVPERAMPSDMPAKRCCAMFELVLVLGLGLLVLEANTRLLGS